MIQEKLSTTFVWYYQDFFDSMLKSDEQVIKDNYDNKVTVF